MALQKVVHNTESEPIFIITSFLLLNSMVKQENKEGSIMNVTQIPANPLFGFKPYKKVAAYCRVSTQQEIQHHSLVAQREYFEQYISGRSNWVFVGIYADEASGRNNANMKEFQRMMKECRKGNIDLILVKSISRLGRNTLQFLQACNELNTLGVEVYFEVENLYISYPNATRMLTIYASLYQQESESKSYAVRWSLITRFRDGTSKLYDRPCYGYRKDANGELEIVPEEACVVKLIYLWHEENESLREIARRLMDIGVKTPKGGMFWHPEAIRRILANEKYYGDVMLQKSYTADYFTGKPAKNNGEYEAFVITDHHDAIIPKSSVQK